MQPSAATEIIHSSLFNIHYSFARRRKMCHLSNHTLLFQGAEKWMQNRETEPRRGLPEAVPCVQRVVKLICLAPFIKP